MKSLLIDLFDSEVSLTKSIRIVATVLVLFIMTLFFVACSEFVETDAPLASFTDHLDQRVPELLEYYDIPASSIAIIKDGSVSWSGWYGYQNREEKNPVTSETLFRAESITKPIVAWGVMHLVEEGKVELDDPIEKHLASWDLPNTQYPEEEVTIRGLLSHSSGITGGSDYKIPGMVKPPLEEVLSGKHGLHKTELVREPGTAFEYSNQGYVLLEMLIENVTERDFGEYMKNEIINPLNMDNTTYELTTEVASNLATSYDLEGEPVPMHVNPFRGPAGLYTTAEDLAVFFAAGMPEKEGREPGRGIIAPESVEALYDSVIEPADFYALGSDSVGLGHFIDNFETGEKAVFHIGEGSGSLGKAYAIPEEGEGIVILTNSKRSWPFLFTLLGEWTDWLGTSQPAMSSIYSNVQTGSWIVIFALLGLSFLKVGSLVKGGRSGNLKFSPLSNKDKTRRLFQGILPILLLGVWFYINHIFIRNLLPVLQLRVTIVLVIFTIIFLISAMFIKSFDDSLPD